MSLGERTRRSRAPTKDAADGAERRPYPIHGRDAVAPLPKIHGTRGARALPEAVRIESR